MTTTLIESSVGFAPITLSKAGARSRLAPLTEDPLTLHWHGDAFDPPAGAQRLAATDLCATHLCATQAFSMGRAVVGFQFHPEAGGRVIEKWLVGRAVGLAATRSDVPRLRAEAQAYGEKLERKACAVAATWLNWVK